MSLIHLSSPGDVLIPRGMLHNATRHRIEQYAAWLESEDRAWFDPDLKAYRDYLLTRLTRRSTRCHLATIRSRYRDLLIVPELWWDLVEARAAANGEQLTPEQMIARSGYLQKVVSDRIDPRAARVTVTKGQDRPDRDRLWLTAQEGRRLIKAPDANTIRGKRDRAVLATGLFLGLRDAEVSALRVSDLFQTLLGAPAVHVRHGKGDKERLVPWGAQLWARALVTDWLEAAAISRDSDEIVFRGLDRWGNPSPEPLSTRGIMRVAEAYPLQAGRDQIKLTWYALRRSYARWAYEAGQLVTAIQANMGHETQAQTWHYIGPVDQEKRHTPTLLDLHKE